MKPTRLTAHARAQCAERGASEDEVHRAIREGTREPAKRDRELCRLNLPHGRDWQGRFYAIKQVAAIIKEEAEELVVITVYTFYF